MKIRRTSSLVLLGFALLAASSCSSTASRQTDTQYVPAGSAGVSASGSGNNASGSTASGGSSGNGGGVGGSAQNGGSSNAGAAQTGGSATQGGSVGSAGAAQLECENETQCPVPASPCQRRVCENNRCGTAINPNPLVPQIKGDCKTAFCTDTGDLSSQFDYADRDDGNECTKDDCSGNGEAVHLVLTNAPCGNGNGSCQSNGTCSLCNLSACPMPSEVCRTRICSAGFCSTGPTARGTLCNSNLDQCDGNGKCEDCVDNGGCGECCVCSNLKCQPA